MSDKVIGVMGCGGRVGRTVCEYFLEKGYKVKGGQRNPAAFGHENFHWVKTDIYDAKTLKEFCKNCAVVINCAGPSYLIEDRIAAASVEAGAKYVDTFGTFLFDKKFSGSIKNGVIVVSAGNVPGLSGILPYYIMHENFDEVDEITEYAGGMDYPTFSSTADVLLSSLKGYGYAGYCYKYGEICNEYADSNKRIKIPGFHEEVLIKPFIGNELIALCRKDKVNKAYSYNAVVSKQLGEVMVNSCIKLAAENNEETLKKCVAEINTQIELSMFGKEPWHTLAVTVNGIKSGVAVSRCATMKMKSSYHVTGLIAAMVAEDIVNKTVSCGIYFPFEIADVKKIMYALLSHEDIFEFTYIDRTETDAFEEGTL